MLIIRPANPLFYEPCMSGSPEDEVANAQLFDLPQSLKLWGIYNLPDILVESDVPVNRV